MFEFIKSLFRKKEPTAEATCPFLVHAEITDSIVISEVALKEKPKAKKAKAPTTAQPKTTKKPVAEVKPVKAVKTKQPTKADALSNVVQLVQPAAKKKGRPKKDKTL